MIDILRHYKAGNYELIENIIGSTDAEVDKNSVAQLTDMLNADDDNYSLKSKIVLFLRKYKSKVDIKQLSNALKTDIRIANQILINPVKMAQFPVVGNNKMKLVSAYVIDIDSEEPFSFKKDKKNQFNIIKKVAHRSFAVLFSGDFVEDSFMLAVYAAVLSKTDISNFIFTGKIDEAGNILSVLKLSEKKALAEKLNKRLMSFETFSTIEAMSYILLNDRIDIPFAAAVIKSRDGDNTRESALKNFKKICNKLKNIKGWDIDNIKRFFSLDNDDFIFYTDENFLPQQNWSFYIKSAFEKLKKLKTKLQNRVVVPHLTFLGASCFAFGFGALYGAKAPFVVYHFSAQNENFEPVLDYGNRNIRDLKENSDTFKQIKYTMESIGENEALIVHLASHQPIGDVRNKIKDEFDNYGIAYISLKQGQGNIPISDWTNYVKELYSFYNITKQYGEIRKRMLFFSCPVPIAFGLGADMENAENISVYNFFSRTNSYYKVFDIGELYKT